MWSCCRHLLQSHLWRWPGYGLAAALVGMALLTVVAQQMLPVAERHPEIIARWLSERAGRQIRFEQVRAHWTRRGPLLQLDGLRIGEGDGAVQIGQAEILVAHYVGWLPGHSLTELRLRGLDLVLERSEGGRWGVRGLPGQAGDSEDPLALLEALGELQVTSARLGIVAPALGIETRLPDVDVRLRVQGTRVRAAVRAWMQPDAAPLQASLELDRRSGTGRARAAIAQTELQPWSPLLTVAGLRVVSGSGSVEGWAKLHAFQVTEIASIASIDAVQLQGTALDEESAPQQVGFGQLRLRGHWNNLQGQWRFHAPLLRIGAHTQPQVLDGLTLAGGRSLLVQAERIDAGPLLAVLALSDRLPPALRQWLQRTRPEAVFRQIALAASAGDVAPRGTLQLEALRIASAGDVPGVDGLAGQLTLGADGALLDLDPEAAVTFDWSRGFGTPHVLHLAGTLTLWQDAGEMSLATPHLRIDGDGYTADVRGGLRARQDGSKARIDLAAGLENAHLPVVKRFWVHHKMPPAAIAWLDAALLSGELRGGQVLVSGELEDWPFVVRNGQATRGMFEAHGELVNARVRFHPGWPPLHQINAQIRFVNDGLLVQGRAYLHQIKLDEISVQLAHYTDGQLQVNAQAQGELGDWLTLLGNSPLQAEHGDVLDTFTATGTATTRFAMHLPLAAGAVPVIDGQAELAATQVDNSAWELELSALAGEVAYDRLGFHADGLYARHAGHDGTIALRAGAGHVRDQEHAVEAELDMPLAATELLARVPQLDWLRPALSGQSLWRVGVTVEKADRMTAAPSTTLHLTSDLVGTTLDLPAPLDKPAGEVLATRIDTRLPWGEGMVDVALGERLAVRAVSRAEQTGIRAEFGQGRMSDLPPANGLDISGYTPRLDASGWMPFLAATSADGLPLHALEIGTDTLHLFGADFNGVRLRAQPQDEATYLTISAPALAGTIQWPKADDAPVVAQLQHLYWPSPSAYRLADTNTINASVTQSAPRGQDNAMDPRQLPPMRLDVAQLYLGNWNLGQASVATRRIPEGIAIDHLYVRGPRQRLDARGEWSGTGAAAITQLEIDVDSQDIGQFLDGIGLGGQIRGGSGTLRLRGQWAANPMQLTPKRLTGSMQVSLRNGQLIEVEPGAGRVLGLLSVAQLPRRLLLDFRDFFGKGFGFNDIGGTIEVSDGIARTDGLRINGPAAKLHIRGSSNLQAQTHDQTIEVAPRTGNLLTAVGALAGGPVGAAVGAATNAILRRPLSEIGARTYHVTGSWQEPQVEVIAHVPLTVSAEEGADSRPVTDTQIDGTAEPSGDEMDDDSVPPADTMSDSSHPSPAAFREPILARFFRHHLVPCPIAPSGTRWPGCTPA